MADLQKFFSSYLPKKLQEHPDLATDIGGSYVFEIDGFGSWSVDLSDPPGTVTEGAIERHAQIRVTRGGIVVEKDRRLEQLKRFKDDAKAVNAGQECGMRIDGYDDIKVGDVLECYKTREVARTLAQ